MTPAEYAAADCINLAGTLCQPPLSLPVLNLKSVIVVASDSSRRYPHVRIMNAPPDMEDDAGIPTSAMEPSPGIPVASRR